MVSKLSYTSCKKILNIIEFFFLYEKSKFKNFYLLDNKKVYKELIDESSYLIKIKEISEYEQDESNCIFISIGKSSRDWERKIKFIKLNPNILIISLAKDTEKKFVFPEIESFGYRMLSEVDNYAIFFRDDYKEYISETKIDIKSDLNKFTKRWGNEFLKNNSYQIINIDSRILLSAKRFDIAIKSHFARLLKLGIARNWREYLYFEHIKRMTGAGNLIREHDGSGKEGIDVFLRNFESLVNERNQEMIPNVPISKSLIPLDGSHRIAAAIVNQNKISCLKFKKNYNIESNYKFFLGNSHLHKSTPIDLIEESAIEYCRIKNSVAIAFLFPSISNHDYAVNLISDFASIVYKKEIIITPKEGKNLFRQIYHGQPWLSWASDNKHFINKTKMCFPFMGKMTIILFDDYKVNKLRLLKKEIRDFYKIGNHSIHITDSTEESLNASKIIFNKNSLNLIRYQRRFLPNFHKYLFELKSWIAFNGIDPEKICIDGSGVMSAFGLRECRDLDFLFLGDQSLLKSLPNKISCHNDIANNYDYEIGEIIGDPRRHFWYLGIKFCCPEQIIQMKIKRNETKDKKDLILLRQIIPSKKLLLIYKIINSIATYKNYFLARIKDKLKNLIKKIMTLIN